LVVGLPTSNSLPQAEPIPEPLTFLKSSLPFAAAEVVVAPVEVVTDTWGQVERERVFATSTFHLHPPLRPSQLEVLAQGERVM
jgi:hypothetical protein